jgi:D-glycero-alpha-D-manno-heptose-7-phosphate kinase
MSVIRVPKKKVSAIKAQAPSRVDLAGGSLDLWPIGVIVENAVTVNCAINLYARVEARKTKDKFLHLASEDYVKEYDFRKGSPPGALPLLEKLCSHYGVTEGWSILVRSDFPAGSGLGGSSAVAVAMAKTLLEIREAKENNLKTVNVCRDLEARNLGIPTGVQDFWPSMLGGILAIHYRPGGDDIESLGNVFPFLAERLVVAYTGQSHFSADNNYELYNAFLQGKKEIVRAMHNIAAASFGLYKALKNSDFDEAGRMMLEEWENRKKLSPRIATPKMEELQKASIDAGAVGAKGCGAAGGGAMVFLVKLGMKRAVEVALEKCGSVILSAEPEKRGCIVEALP